MKTDFDGLLAAVLAGTASRAEEVRFAELLKADKDFRAEYLDAAEIEALLRRMHGRSMAISPKRKPPGWLVPLGATCAVAATLAIFTIRPEKSSPQLVPLSTKTTAQLQQEEYEMNKTTLASSAIALALSSASAEMVVWGPPNDNNTSGHYGFFAGDYWSDRLAPHSDADYLVVSNRYLRTPDNASSSSSANNYVFAGKSITLGAIGGGNENLGKILCKTIGQGCFTFPPMSLVHGHIDTGSPGVSRLFSDKITIANNPGDNELAFFYINGTGSDERELQLHAPIDGGGRYWVNWNSSETDKAGYKKMTCSLYGDNSAYTGDAIIKGTNVYLNLSSATALGGEFPSLNERAVELRLTGGLEVNTNTLAYSSATRGVYLSETHGAIYNGHSTIATTLDLPFSGPGKLYKKGAGKMFLQGAYGATGGISVEAGTLDVSGATFASSPSISVSSGTTLAISSALSAKVSFAAGAKLDVAFSKRSGTPVLTLLEGSSISSPLAVSVTPDESMNFGTDDFSQRTKVLEFPSGADYSASDFSATLSASSGDTYGLLKTSFMVEDGALWATITLRPLATMVKSCTSMGMSWETAGVWDNGQAAKSGCNYLVKRFQNGTLLRTPHNDAISSHYDFPGDSLTFEGSGTGWNGESAFLFKCGSATVPDLRMGQWAAINVGSDHSTHYRALYGKMTVSGTVSAPTIVTPYGTRKIAIHSDLYGSGCLFISQYADAANKGDGFASCRLLGDNSNFTGSFYVKYSNRSGSTAATDSSGYTTVLEFADEKNLGTTHSQKIEGYAVKIEYNTGIRPCADCVLQSPDLNMNFISGGSGGWIFVDLANLTLKNPVNINGPTKVTGGKTLAIGRSFTGSGNLIITNATLKPLVADVAPAAKKTFRADARLALPFPGKAADASVLDYGIVCTNSAPVLESPLTLSLYGDTPSRAFSVPVFTTAADVELDTSKIVSAKVDKMILDSWTVQETMLGGNPCKVWKANYKSTAGTVVMLLGE